MEGRSQDKRGDLLQKVTATSRRLLGEFPATSPRLPSYGQLGLRMPTRDFPCSDWSCTVGTVGTLQCPTLKRVCRRGDGCEHRGTDSTAWSRGKVKDFASQHVGARHERKVEWASPPGEPTPLHYVTPVISTSFASLLLLVHPVTSTSSSSSSSWTAHPANVRTSWLALLPDLNVSGPTWATPLDNQ